MIAHINLDNGHYTMEALNCRTPFNDFLEDLRENIKTELNKNIEYFEDVKDEAAEKM